MTARTSLTEQAKAKGTSATDASKARSAESPKSSGPPPKVKAEQARPADAKAKARDVLMRTARGSKTESSCGSHFDSGRFAFVRTVLAPK